MSLKQDLDALMIQRVCYCSWKKKDCTFWKLEAKREDGGYCVVNQHRPAKMIGRLPCEEGEWTC